jgi:hypothetical protein
MRTVRLLDVLAGELGYRQTPLSDRQADRKQSIPVLEPAFEQSATWGASVSENFTSGHSDEDYPLRARFDIRQYRRVALDANRT